jgi:hypothetical protein
MRNKLLAAIGLAVLAVASWSATPAVAVTLAAPAALKSASDSVAVAETVNCGCGDDWGWRRPYYRHYDRPYYRQAYRPYYRSYHRSYWSGDDGWYPRPRRFHFGPPLYDFDY